MTTTQKTTYWSTKKFCAVKSFLFRKMWKNSEKHSFFEKTYFVKFDSDNFPCNFFVNIPVHKQASIKFSGNSTVRLLRKLPAKMLWVVVGGGDCEISQKLAEYLLKKLFDQKIHQNVYWCTKFHRCSLRFEILPASQKNKNIRQSPTLTNT